MDEKEEGKERVGKRGNENKGARQSQGKVGRMGGMRRERKKLVWE